MKREGSRVACRPSVSPSVVKVKHSLEFYGVGGRKARQTGLNAEGGERNRSGSEIEAMRKSCDVTDVVKTFRKHTEACRIDLMNFDWNQSAIPASINGFTECFDGVCDVTRLPHS